ncbi:hypothetical protein V493_02979 [Pseudogymnoascus sp. VKM F-4281 (FW-2241)]|nr:hypothetical protein V493_02979 [Pseudogymnoascus sp. VKM F-4281 (FW-2241)]
MSSSDSGPLYLGFDLSTQQLKAVVITSALNVAHEAKVDFDADLAHHGITKGVFHPTPSEVTAPVAMWLEAVDLVLSRLREAGAPLDRIRGISGAGQQHGSVFWNKSGEETLSKLDAKNTLVEQLKGGFSCETSPNWQDASTQNECDAFDKALGTEEELAKVTGSKAHHRFTGPQIMKFKKNNPDVYEKTTKISLVSSFLASVFLGSVAPIDISDVCGMNLWNIAEGAWDWRLLSLAGGSKEEGEKLRRKLGDVRSDGGGSMGAISDYYVQRYGFSKECQIAPFTGDNPSTILSLPLRAGDAMVSLGTSTTFLMSTPHFVADPAVHFFNHPTTSGLYMFMLCYKNGGLAREKTRDSLAKPTDGNVWSTFEKTVLETPPLGKKTPQDPAKLGLYFPLPEIVPNVRAGTWRFSLANGALTESAEGWKIPEDDARTIVESQVLSLRLRSKNLVVSPDNVLPAQPKRIYLVGGGSLSPAIARVVGDVLGGAEGVYKLDVGGNACALGGAYKAVWAVERKGVETFEDLIGARWNESEAVEKVDIGYRPDVWKAYDEVLPAFEEAEKQVLAQEKRNV